MLTRDICRLSSDAMRERLALSKLSVTARSSEFGGACTAAFVTCSSTFHVSRLTGRIVQRLWDVIAVVGCDHLPLLMSAALPRAARIVHS